MKTNVFNPSLTTFREVTVGLFGAPAGVAGWVDTDVSATTGVDTNRVWMVACVAGAAQDVGVRKHGNTGEPHFSTNHSQLTMVDSNGHVDLYRGPGADNYYSFIGYLE